MLSNDKIICLLQLYSLGFRPALETSGSSQSHVPPPPPSTTSQPLLITVQEPLITLTSPAAASILLLSQLPKQLTRPCLHLEIHSIANKLIVHLFTLDPLIILKLDYLIRYLIMKSFPKVTQLFIKAINLEVVE